MADIANLQFRADTGDIKNANAVLDQLAQTAAKTEKAADSLGQSVSNVGKGGTSGLKVTKQELNSLLDSLNPTSKAFDELDKSMRQLQAARNQKLIGAEQFADFSAIIDRQRTALQRTYDDLTGYTDRVKAAAAVEKQAAASRQADIASLDRLRAVLNPASEAAKKLQEQFTLLNRARLSGAISSTEYSTLRQQLIGLNKEVKESTLSAGALRAGWAGATQQFIDLGVQLQGGANPITALIQQGPQLAYAFGSVGDTLNAFKQQFTEVAKNFGFGADSIQEQASEINESVGEISESLNNTVDASKNVAAGFARFITPLNVGIAAIVAGVAYLGYQAYKAAAEMDTFQKAINSTGNTANLTARNLSDLADAVAESTDSSRSSAAQAVAVAASFATSTEQIRQFTEAALVLSESTGQGVEEILGQFKRLAADPVQALVTLNEQYGFADRALYEHVKSLTDAGDKTAAMTVVVDALERSTKQMADTTQTSINNSTGFWDNLAYSIGNAWSRLRQYNAENSKKSYSGIGGGGSYDKNYDPYGVKAQAEETAKSSKKIKDGVDAMLASLDAQVAKTRQLKKEQVAASAEIDKLTARARSNAEIRADEEKRYNDQLKRGVITQEQYNKAVAALNELYKDPKAKKERQQTVKADSGDRLTEQYQAQNLALDTQIKMLQNRGAYQANASQQEKSYYELQAKYTVLEQAATERKLTAQEKQMLAVKDEALEQARILADKGKTLAALQRQAQVEDEISKLSSTQALQAEVYTKYQGQSSKELQRQLELAQTRAAILAKGGTEQQANAAQQIKQIDFDQADARAQDWISGMKTGLADWADAATNYAKIASDAIQKGMQTATAAVSDFVTTGKFDFADFTKTILKMIVDIISQLLVMNALKAGASALGFGSLFANAKGGVYDDPSLSRYSNGVYSSPQFFSFGGRTQFANGGVFAEAGPEAIMPLSRDSNGRLGVKAEGMGGSSGVSIQQSITINSDGSAKTSATSGDAMGRAVGDQLNAAVVQQVQKMLQPGGLIYRYTKGG